MTQEEYIALQLVNIQNAIDAGNRLLDISRRLHRTCDAADQEAPERHYLRDAFMYYDFSDAASEIAGMPEELKSFKNQLIEIKIANDRMLLEGGFNQDIDKEIARVFLTYTLCKITIIDEKVLDAVRDAVATLLRLKEKLETK